MSLEQSFMASSDLAYLLSLWERGELPPERVPDLCVDAMSQGCECNAVALLAASSGSTRADIEEHLPELLDQLALTRPNADEARKIVLDRITAMIVSGEMAPADGGRRLWLVAGELDAAFEDGPLWEELRPFVGLVSEWDDHPHLRSEFDAQIVHEASQIVERGGFSL